MNSPDSLHHVEIFYNFTIYRVCNYTYTLTIITGILHKKNIL